jgi:hypothetical protein
MSSSNILCIIFIRQTKTDILYAIEKLRLQFPLVRLASQHLQKWQHVTDNEMIEQTCVMCVCSNVRTSYTNIQS